MTRRITALVLALGVGLAAATGAQAFFMDDDGPPKGLNGLTSNGFSLKGFAHPGVAITAVVLSDGTRVVVK